MSPDQTRSVDFGPLGTSEQKTRPQRRPVAWSGGADIGLLLLRFGVGGLFFAHGAQKVFGLWGGLGIARTTDVIAGYGFFAQASTLAWLTGIVELIAGAFVVLGLFTPLAAAALLAIKIVAIVVKWGVPFYAAAAPNALELDVLLGLGAAALVFTGAGRVSLDNGRTWQRRPLPYAWMCAILGVGAALVVLFTLRR
ncbi:DoxX family protein [Pseudonocardia acidicola]|uniref:DoxX family protein n=1 Tax=Pseudonocardia acidicola TaxID=2724939 RepID=A0ABX1SII6_9PSEU|nr:DoxX family protein [Pseudonocardia acidicola]NMI01382.1 DoxX family protein [Pseudonocardia acidicola]